MNSTDMRKLEAEDADVRLGDAKQCKSKTGDDRCARVLGHVGCHFAWMTLTDKDGNDIPGSKGGGTMRWAAKGERLKAAYPRGGAKARATT